MRVEYTWPNILKGGIIYSLGDSIAAIISDDFSLIRLIGIMIIGATIYALEIPNYFRWIDRKIKPPWSIKKSIYRGLLAMAYFNPLWIARHILFIYLLSGNIAEVGWFILWIGLQSFLVNVPISLGANYLIQNKISFKFRFIASAIFSGLMAIYYSFSAIWFN